MIRTLIVATASALAIAVGGVVVSLGIGWVRLSRTRAEWREWLDDGPGEPA